MHFISTTDLKFLVVKILLRKPSVTKLQQAALVGLQLPYPEDQVFSNFDYLAKLPATEKKKTNPTRPCRICTKNKVRKECRYFCEKCKDNSALCVDPCFQMYHQQLEENYSTSSEDDKLTNSIM